MISQIQERAVAFAYGFLYEEPRLASSNRIVSKSRQKVNLSADHKGEHHYEPIICKKGLTAKDLVTVRIFSALFLVFALVGGIFFAPNPVLRSFGGTGSYLGFFADSDGRAKTMLSGGTEQSYIWKTVRSSGIGRQNGSVCCLRQKRQRRTNCICALLRGRKEHCLRGCSAGHCCNAVRSYQMLLKKRCKRECRNHVGTCCLLSLLSTLNQHRNTLKTLAFRNI